MFKLDIAIIRAIYGMCQSIGNALCVGWQGGLLMLCCVILMPLMKEVNHK